MTPLCLIGVFGERNARSFEDREISVVELKKCYIQIPLYMDSGV
jgi:hypothetical protein